MNKVVVRLLRSHVHRCVKAIDVASEFSQINLLQSRLQPGVPGDSQIASGFRKPLSSSGLASDSQDRGDKPADTQVNVVGLAFVLLACIYRAP